MNKHENFNSEGQGVPAGGEWETLKEVPFEAEAPEREQPAEPLEKDKYQFSNLRLGTNDFSSLEVTPRKDDELDSREGDKQDPERDDRRVYARGRAEKRAGAPGKETSSIMFGYNRGGITFENGKYLSVEDLGEAIEANLAEAGEGARLVERVKGEDGEEYYDVELADAMASIFATATREHSSINLSPSAVTNQDAPRIAITDAKTGEEHPRGLLMLGNEQVHLPEGDYITVGAMGEAVRNYLMAKPIEGEPAGAADGTTWPGETRPQPQTPRVAVEDYAPPEEPPEEPTLGEKLRGWGKQAKELAEKGAMTLLTTAVLIVPVPGGMAVELPTVFAQQTPMEQVVEQEPQPSVEETAQQIMEQQMQKERGLEIGDTAHLAEGTVVHESSDYLYGGRNAEGVIGSEYLPASNPYKVSEYSILVPNEDGAAQEYRYRIGEDGVTEEEGTDLNEFVGQIMQETGLSWAELMQHAEVHVQDAEGGDVGWIDYDNFAQAATMTDEEVNLDWASMAKAATAPAAPAAEISTNNGGN